jgi:D-alanyl-D-alanine carboxypeptidase
MKTKLLLCMIGIGVLPISSCKKDQTINSNSKVFKVDLFKSGLQAQLSNAIGYAFAINQGGHLADTASLGMGAFNTGAPQTSASVQHDGNIASVTKPLTAIAAIKLMEEKGVLMNFPIGPWLPDSWTKSTAMSNITFSQLLTHTSGIRQSNTSWDSIKSTIAGPLEGAQTYSYSNVNFGLFRALLPKLDDAAFFVQKEQTLSTTNFENWMNTKYLSVMQEEVFTPSGVANAICNVTPGATTMQAFNELNNPPLIPRNPGDWTALSGGGGYYLSTLEMAEIMAYLAHTSNLLNQSQKNTMDDNLYGWDPSDSFMTNYGQAYGKDGALFWDNNGDGTNNSGDSGLQTWVGKFPNGVELALSITSIRNGYRSLPTIIKTAYEDAWVYE